MAGHKFLLTIFDIDNHNIRDDILRRNRLETHLAQDAGETASG